MKLDIRDGQVLCPKRGRCDVEQCMPCSAFRGLARAGTVAVCKPPLGATQHFLLDSHFPWQSTGPLGS